MSPHGDRVTGNFRSSRRLNHCTYRRGQASTADLYADVQDAFLVLQQRLHAYWQHIYPTVRYVYEYVRDVHDDDPDDFHTDLESCPFCAHLEHPNG